MKIKEEKIFKLFSDFSWVDLLEIDKENQRISVLETGEIIYKKDGKNSVLNFYSYNQEEKKVNARKGSIVLVFSDGIDISEIVEFWNSEKSSGYTLSFNQAIFKRILRISFNGIEKIKISKEYKKITTNRSKKEILVPFDKLIEIKERASEIERIGSKRKESIKTYLINQSIKKYLNKEIKGVTTTEKGDFSFLIDRFNLKTKKTKKDFNKYLDSEDISKIEIFTDTIIRKEIFSKEYLRRLDEYFIKEKLEEIIKIGKKIINLKTEDIKTGLAKKVIKLLHSSKDIKQMENIWQKFFEDNLLYLIFSYKKIIPKVKLDISDVEKKYPDFVGVNHYNGVDVIEIKTHLKNALVWDSSHKNFAFSSELSKAIVQTINYLDAITQKRFKKEDDKKELLKNIVEEENLYHPRGIVIISSTDRIVKNQSKLNKGEQKKLRRDFTKLRNSIQNIEILTFDEVLGIAEKYTENIRKIYSKNNE